MKKFVLSLIVAFAAQSAMANVQLEAEIAPLNPVPGSLTKFVKIYKSGEVHVTQCETLTGNCYPTAHVATLSWYAMNYINGQIEMARAGALIEDKDGCTEAPTISRTYTADDKTVLLEKGTYPCGSVFMNQTDAAYYLVSVLKQYEN